MRRVFVYAGLGAVLVVGEGVMAQRVGRGTPIQAGEACPPGTTEIRPRTCLAPEAPAPSILDCRPHSTLVAPVHMVMRAKYPVIDFHCHPQGRLGTSDALTSLGASLDSLNVRLMVSADVRNQGESVRRWMAASQLRRMSALPGRMARQ